MYSVWFDRVNTLAGVCYVRVDLFFVPIFRHCLVRHIVDYSWLCR